LTEEIQTAFQAVIRVVNYVKNSPVRGRSFATLCDDMEAEQTVLLYRCEADWLCRDKVTHREFELGGEIVIF